VLSPILVNPQKISTFVHLRPGSTHFSSFTFRLFRLSSFPSSSFILVVLALRHDIRFSRTRPRHGVYSPRSHSSSSYSYSSFSSFVLAAPHHLFSSYTYSPRSRLFSPLLHPRYCPPSFVVLANGVVRLHVLANGVLRLHALATESFVWVLPILSSFILVLATSPRHLSSSFVLVVFILAKLFALWSVCLRRRIFLVCPSGHYI
jgi:hypothetical protein